MPTWYVLLITNEPVKFLGYIVAATSRDIALDKCVRDAVERDGVHIKEMFAHQIDMSRPHRILQG